MIFDVSIGLVIFAIIAYMALGALWYSPSLFGGPWMRALGKKKEEMSGAALKQVNSFEAPALVSPKKNTATLKNKVLKLTLKPYSFNVIKIPFK